MFEDAMPQATYKEAMVGTTLKGRISGQLPVVEVTNQGGGTRGLGWPERQDLSLK
jgi:hypothetical protein